METEAIRETLKVLKNWSEVYSYWLAFIVLDGLLYRREQI